VPQLQRAGSKRHYSVTRVDEELKAIFKKLVFRTRLKGVLFYRWRREQFLVETSRWSDQQPKTIVCRASSYSSRNRVVDAGWWTMTLAWGVIMERGDDISEVSRALIGMDEEHRERDYVLDSIKNRKPIEAGKSRGNVVSST